MFKKIAFLTTVLFLWCVLPTSPVSAAGFNATQLFSLSETDSKKQEIVHKPTAISEQALPHTEKYTRRTTEEKNSDEKVFYIYADHINTPRQVVNSSNDIVWEWAVVDPFGAHLPSSKDGFTLNIRFPGQYYDAETGLHHNYYRDYDPYIGRYIQSDPVGLQGGINRFSYVGSSPLDNVDPEGLQAIPLPPMLIPGTAGGTIEVNRRLAMAAVKAMSRSRTDDNEISYQTYTRYNRITGQCYSGRTSGYGSPEQNVKNRAVGQPLLNAEGFDPPILDKSSPNKSAIRGREQQLIVENGGARSAGGYSRNAINGVSPLNPRRIFYEADAIAEFGQPFSTGSCTCR